MTKANDAKCIELHSLEELNRHLEREKSLEGLALQGLDLKDPGMELRLTSLPALGAYFLGCALSQKAEVHIRKTGGTIFPDFRGLPFNAYRSSLYTVEELMEGYERGRRASLSETVDGKIYDYFQSHRSSHQPVPIIPALSFRIHDHAIDNAVHDLLYPKGAEPLKVVAVMGGHKMARDDDAYTDVARITHRLSRKGYFVTSGGGPGAMEAANLGGYFAALPEHTLEKAAAQMSDRPSYQDDGYIERAYEVIDQHPKGERSLAIPSWFYGHEPTNLFASHVAKYFANSLREDGMLALAQYGVIYAPGSAGTIQEVFMDAAQNRYQSYGVISPMVFFGTQYWTETKPVYPLLKSLAEGRAYENFVTITDDPHEVVRFILENPPVWSDE
jgi:predicted Rossmann-fold nucleotide-binding protein